MLKALLVDDEWLSLQMMLGIIDWGSYGVQIAATAADGAEALEKFREISPGLIITDIKMPRLSGLEFIKKVRQIDEWAEILLISAYADFGYVKEALALGCANYLLKPIDETELERALEAIVSRITSRDISQRLVDKSHIFKRNQTLKDCMRSGVHLSQAKAILVEMCIPPSPFSLMDVKLKYDTINEYSGIKSVAGDQMGYIREAIEEIAGRNCRCLAFDLEDYSFVLLLATGDVKLLKDAAEAIVRFLREEPGLRATACFSGSAARGEELPVLHAQLLKLVRYSQYLDCEEVLGYGLNCSREEVDRASLVQWMDDLTLSLTKHNAGEASRILREALDEGVRLGPLELSRVYDFCFGAVLKCASLMREVNQETAWIADLTYAHVAEKASMDALYAFMTEIFQAVCSPQNHEEKGRYSRLVEDGIVFLNQQYARNISLEEICGALAVSKNYFSTLFKRDTGISLWAYLTNIRMAKARELLQYTDLRSHEIAYSVGYDNPSYFSKLFKKINNQTPNEFRAALSQRRGIE